jgi:HD-like signal output (HDOD) protein
MDARARSADYGRGVVTLKTDAEDDLLSTLKMVFESPTYEPPLLPAAAVELIELSRKSDVTIPEIVALVERDPFIAARVLRVAQSPRYTCSGGVPSLHHAAVRLGLDTMTNIFLEVATHMRVFRARGYEAPMERLRRHSVATANIARIVCRYTSIFDEYAFLCGLFHDVGIAAAMIILSERKSQKPRSFSDEWRSIKPIHAQAARTLCQLWKLPPDVAFVTAHHHAIEIGGHAHPVAAAIAVAEVVASKLGYGFEDEVGAEMPFAAMRAIDLSESAVGAITSEAKTKLGDLA